jgi:short-subunit dehydrogenase
MINGVTGPGKFGSARERIRGEPKYNPFRTPWWRRWVSSPVDLLTNLVRPDRATRGWPRRGEPDHLSRVHSGHRDPSRVDYKPAKTPRHRPWDSARCLITGASSGLGKALAERLVRAGAHVVLTGRSAERLQAVAQGLIGEGADPTRVIVIRADLTDAVERRELFAQLAVHFDALDLVINTAGVGAAGPFDTHDPAVLRKVFEINVFALAEVCRASLPLLARGHRPALVNMGSIVARRGLPGRAEYSASKFAVTGLTEALRLEWRRFGVHILQVNPGFINTPFDQHAIVDTARYSVAHLRTISADTVALTIIRAVQRQKREIVLTWQGNLLLRVNSIAPRFIDWGFTRWLFRYYPKSPAP